MAHNMGDTARDMAYGEIQSNTDGCFEKTLQLRTGRWLLVQVGLGGPRASGREIAVNPRPPADSTPRTWSRNFLERCSCDQVSSDRLGNARGIAFFADSVPLWMLHELSGAREDDLFDAVVSFDPLSLLR